MSDEDPAYAKFGQRFADHKTVKHSETFSAPGGVSNNLAESFNWRARRAAEGISPMATPNCSTNGRSNCSRQDGRMVTIRA